MKKILGHAVFKGVLFALAFHLLSVINMILCINRVFEDLTCLVCLLALCVLSIPVYFIVKEERSWKYTLISMVTHIGLMSTAFIVLPYCFTGLENGVLIYLTEIFVCVTFCVIFVCDLFFNRKKRESEYF